MTVSGCLCRWAVGGVSEADDDLPWRHGRVEPGEQLRVAEGKVLLDAGRVCGVVDCGCAVPQGQRHGATAASSWHHRRGAGGPERVGVLPPPAVTVRARPTTTSSRPCRARQRWARPPRSGCGRIAH